MIAEELLQSTTWGTPKKQLDMLAHFHLIDLGIITGYNEDGSVNVQTLYLDNGKEVIFTNVEVLYIGTNAGAITYDVDGALCLLLKPMTCIPDTSTLMIRIGESPFSNAGMKAIPITRANNPLLRTGFNGDGEFSIEGEGVRIQVGTKAATITNGVDTITIGAAEGFSQVLCGGRLFRAYGATIEKTLYDSEGEALLTESIDGDGQVTITKGSATVSISDTEDDKQEITLSANGASIVIDKDGNININCTKLSVNGSNLEVS